MTNIVNIYATSGGRFIYIPKCRNLVIQLFGAGGGGGSGKTRIEPSNYYGTVNLSCGGGGGGGGVYGRITVNNGIAGQGLAINSYVGVGGSGGLETMNGNSFSGANGKDGQSTYIIYNNSEKYEAQGGKGGQFGDYNLPIGGNGGDGGQKLTITRTSTNQPINPADASLQVSNPFISFGGGGGIYLNADSEGIENPIGGLGGKGFVNGEALFAEYNGSDGDYIGNTTNINDKRGGYGGGKLGNLGGNASNYKGIAGIHTFLNGAGSGGSPGSEMAVFGTDNHPSDGNQGSGAGYSQPIFVNANASRNGASGGGGGGGGVGGFVINALGGYDKYIYNGWNGSKGGDGKIIVSYTLI